MKKVILIMVLSLMVVPLALAEEAANAADSDATFRDEMEELWQDRRETRGDKRELAEDWEDIQEFRREGDRDAFREGIKEYREDRRELREDMRGYREDKAELFDDAKSRRRSKNPKFTDEEIAKMKQLHEQYPSLNRRQLYKAMKNPERFRKYVEFRKNHPNVDLDKADIAKMKWLHEKYPDMTRRQLYGAVKNPKRFRSYQYYKNNQPAEDGYTGRARRRNDERRHRRYNDADRSNRRYSDTRSDYRKYHDADTGVYTRGGSGNKGWRSIKARKHHSAGR